MAFICEKNFLLNIGELIIGNASVQDANELITFIKQVDGESDFLIREAHEFNLTLEQEIKYIEGIIESEKNLLLTAKLDGKIVGTLGFNTQSRNRYKHQGRFGISILKAYWGNGIGTKLMEALIDWTERIGLVRLTLEVDADNERAITLYEKFGFEREGILKYDKYLGNGIYKDSIIMARTNYNLLKEVTNK